ncbi:TonB-dependent receptor [Alcaligenaceae bacterium]|nr:TonB-dependent receptor [Alcaligenaceae bacterium]
MQKHLKRHSLAIISCFLPFAASAQSTPPVSQLGSVVVTASRTPQPLKDVVGDVSVISSQELERSGQSSLVDVISKQPGVRFTNSGGPQTLTNVFLRGANSNHTLVLVDGIRVNGAVSGGVQWAAIDPATVERVEILRGAASSLYGSDAIGGVINIITKKTGEDRPFAAWGNIGIGSYDTFKSSIGFSGASNGWDYSLSSSMAESGGFNATNPDAGFLYNPDTDGYSQHALSGSLGYRWRPGQHIGLTAYNGYIDGDYDSGPAMSRVHGISRQQAYTLTSTNEITNAWESVVRFGFSKESYDDRGSYGDSLSQTTQRSYLWQNNLQLSENHKVTALVERIEERLKSTNTFTEDKRNTNAIGLIYSGNFGPAHLQASARNDNISGYGNKKTGSLALDFDLTPNWQVGIAGSTGFKAPSFESLYTPKGWGTPNPNLKAEQSRNIEASLKYQNDTTLAALTIYQNKIKDLIVYDYAGSYNEDKATIRGVTLSASQEYGNTTLRASADFMNPRNDTTGNQLARRARQVYNVGVDHSVGYWTLGAEYQFTGKRYDDAKNTESRKLGGHSLLNLTAAYDFTDNVGVQVRWNNILDKSYSDTYGYNTPGSNVFINLSWRM